MSKFKFVLAGVAAAGVAFLAAPEPAKAGGISIGIGFGHPGFVSHWDDFDDGFYHRPFVKKVVVVRRHQPVFFHRPFVRKRVVFVHRPFFHHRRFLHRTHFGGFGHGWR